VNYLGYPTFFKENRIHRVTVSPEGAHRIDETVCRGVQKGSAKSLVVVNETLYYKSCSDVCAYQGGFPRGISAALGAVPYHAAVGGAVGNKYYLSVLDEDERPVLFVYDIEKDLWLREDALRVTDFARVGDELYAVAGYDEGRGLFDTTLSGPLVSFTCASASRPLKELSVTIAAIQEGSGDPSLENIRPVRGWSGAEITLSPAQNIAGGTVYPVSWQMNAGLVYGGEMDVTHGILTVTHTCIRLTDRTVWMTSSSVAGRYLLNNTDSRNLVKGQTGFLCSHFKPAASSSMTGTVYVSSGPNVVFNTPFATMAEWQAYLGEQEAAGTPVMCVCKLAVPQVYQLPAREVRTIPGENTVQCDAGEVCLTYVDHDPGDFSLRTLCGSLPIDGATAEEEVAWEAVSGMLYYEYPENKRASRYNIRLKIDRGAALAVYVQYDSDGVWRCAGSLSAAGDGGTDSYLFPVRPHRCDHLQLKLCGRGAVRIYSIARILEVGSDYR